MNLRSRRVFAGFLGLGLLTLVAGCFGGGAAAGGGTTPHATLQAPTPVGPASLQIVNRSNEPIYYIYMSPTSQSTWGADLLGSQVLHVGQSFTISNIGAGGWDIRVVDRSQNYKEWRNAYLEAGGVYSIDVSSENWSR